MNLIKKTVQNLWLAQINMAQTSGKRTISQHNIPLLYISGVLRMFQFIMPIRILWMQQLLSNAQISTLTGWLFASVLLFEMPTGALADLLGKRWTMMISSVSMVLALGLYLWAGDFWQFALAMTLQGLAESLKSGAVSAMMYDSLAEDGLADTYRQKYSRGMTYVQFGIVAATFLGGWLGSFGLDVPFKATMLVVALAFFVDFFLREPKIDTDKFNLRNYVKQVVDGTKHLFRTSQITRLALLYIGVAGIGWTFQRLLRDMILINVGYDQLWIGLITGTFRLINILFLAKLVSSVKVIRGGWDILFLPILMVLSYVPGFWLNQWVSLPVVAGLMMIGTGRFMIYGPYLQDKVESKYRATTISVANMLVSLVLAANMFALGIVFELVDIRQVLLGYGLISLFVIIPLAMKVRRDELGMG